MLRTWPPHSTSWATTASVGNNNRKTPDTAANADRNADIDWEYPGGNGQDYRQTPNDKKTGEIEAYALLLAEIKAAIGDKELSIAIPGKKVDMIAFTEAEVPKIDKAVDFINVRPPPASPVMLVYTMNY